MLRRLQGHFCATLGDCKPELSLNWSRSETLVSCIFGMYFAVIRILWVWLRACCVSSLEELRVVRTTVSTSRIPELRFSRELLSSVLGRESVQEGLWVVKVWFGQCLEVNWHFCGFFVLKYVCCGSLFVFWVVYRLHPNYCH